MSFGVRKEGRIYTCKRCKESRRLGLDLPPLLVMLLLLLLLLLIFKLAELERDKLEEPGAAIKRNR